METPTGDRANTISPSGSAGLTPEQTAHLASEATGEAGPAQSESVPFSSQVREAAESGNLIGTVMQKPPSRFQNKRVRKIALSSLLIAIVATIAVVIVANRSQSVKVITIGVGPIRRDQEFIGYARLRTLATVRAEVSGSIINLNAQRGMTVTKGTVVGKIENAQTQAAIERSEQDREMLQLNLRRAESTLEKEKGESRNPETIVPFQHAVLAGQQMLAKTEERLLSMRRELLRQFVRVPVSGVIAELFVSPGSLVSAGQELLAITTPGLFEIELQLDSAAELEVSDAVTIRTDHQQLDGLVALIDRQARRAIVSILQPEVKLTDGERVRALVVYAEKQRSILVPRSALARRAGIEMVWTIVDGKAVATPFRAGIRSATWVEATSGIDSGARVIDHPSLLLEPGQSVKPE